jgi:hypothetical protein
MKSRLHIQIAGSGLAKQQYGRLRLDKKINALRVSRCFSIE